MMGGSGAMLVELVKNELMALQTCLPENGEGLDSRDLCSGAKTKCTLMGFGAGQVSGIMAMPEPLLGAPLPDIFERVAIDQGLTGAINQYEAYTSQCVPQGWDGWHKSTPKDYVRPTPTDEQSAEAAAKAAASAAEAAANNAKESALSSPAQTSALGAEQPSSKKSAGGGGGSFFGGKEWFKCAFRRFIIHPIAFHLDPDLTLLFATVVFLATTLPFPCLNKHFLSCGHNKSSHAW